MAMNNRPFCYELAVRPAFVAFIAPSLVIVPSPGDMASVGNLSRTPHSARFDYARSSTDGEADFGVYENHGRTRISPRGAETGVLVLLPQK